MELRDILIVMYNAVSIPEKAFSVKLLQSDASCQKLDVIMRLPYKHQSHLIPNLSTLEPIFTSFDKESTNRKNTLSLYLIY